MRHGLLTALALLAACGGARPRATTPLAPGGAVAAPAAPTAAAPTGARADAIVTGRPIIPETWSLAGKGVAVSRPRAMVVSGHPLASRVGLEVLKAGGNAVDAAVTVGFALGVVLPEAGNIGGGGFIVFRDTTGRVRALDYREMAPGGATRAMYVDSTGNPTEQSLTGHLASGVPGSVAGMYEAWKSAGRLPWAKVLAPAIRVAREHGRRHDGRDPEHHGGLRHAAAVRERRLCPSRGRGDAPRLHGPQPLARRPGLRRHAAGAVALQVLRRRAARPDPAGPRHAHAAARHLDGRGHRDHALLRRRCRGQRRRGHHHVERRLRQRGHGDGRRLPSEQRDGRLHHRAGKAEHVWPDPGRRQRHRAVQAHAVGDDAVDRAGTRRPAAHGARDAGRADHHQPRVSGHRERGGPRHVARGGGRGAARAPAGAAGRGLLRARRARPDDARRPARYGLPATRAGSHGRYRGHRTHRRRLGRCRRSQARRRRRRILKDQAARFTVSGLLSLSVIAAPLGRTTSMSREARAAAAPAAAPTAPPITAPFAFLPSSLPTRAPATAPPPTLAASALVTPRPCITVSLDSTVASIA